MYYTLDFYIKMQYIYITWKMQVAAKQNAHWMPTGC